jgi:Uma2 family endonuclease
MTTAAPPAPTIPTTTSHCWFNAADLLEHLGDVEPSRVRMNPAPGTATLEDLIDANENRAGPICEWVDGTLVEKTVGFREAALAILIGFEFELYLRKNDIGMIAGPEGVMKILPGIGRAPDLTFIRWDDLPGGKPPDQSDKVPAVVPSLAVEVLSASNRPREVARKRGEYLQAGVKLVWEIDPVTRSAQAYRSLTEWESIPTGGTLDAGDVMPGFQLALQAIFERADRRA